MQIPQELIFRGAGNDSGVSGAFTYSTAQSLSLQCIQLYQTDLTQKMDVLVLRVSVYLFVLLQGRCEGCGGES